MNFNKKYLSKIKNNLSNDFDKKISKIAVESEARMNEVKDLDLLFDNNEVVNAGFWGRTCSRLSTKNKSLQQENQRLREALEEINKVKLYNMPVIQGYGEKNYLKWYDLEHSAALNMQSLAQQALGE